MGHRHQPAPSGFDGYSRTTSPGSESIGGAMRKVVVAVLRFYKRFVSPALPSACRFHPTCSEYMRDAVQKYGVFRGVSKGVLRLLRCHPFHHGGFDPVR